LSGTLCRVLAVMLYLIVAPTEVRGAPDPASSLPVYVTRQDCSRLVSHHPDAGVAYQPGTDAHGHYVAPADLPNDNALKILPDRLTFELKVNPLSYGGASANNAARFGNSAASLGKIGVDLLSGALTLDGRPLEDEQSRIVLAACRQAGYR
jgi:hypothetical protein